MIDKTRQQLIEAARLLFVRKGYDETTMQEVAQAAGKGRRTLYCYYRSKKALLRAVVEAEMNRILEVLQAIVDKDIPADDKMVEFIISRLNNVRHSIFRNGSLRADFTRYMRTIDSIRNRSEKREIALITAIIEQGIREGTFEVDDVSFMASLIHYATKGLENPYIRGEIAGTGDKRVLEHTARRILLYSLRK